MTRLRQGSDVASPLGLGVRTDDGWDYVPAPAPGADVWTLRTAPFGTLTVFRTGQAWDAVWHPADTLARYTVAGPFGTAEDARAAALRWLFDSWSSIETQLGGNEPEPVLRAPAWWLWAGLGLTALVAVGVFNGLQRAFG